MIIGVGIVGFLKNAFFVIVGKEPVDVPHGGYPVLAGRELIEVICQA